MCKIRLFEATKDVPHVSLVERDRWVLLHVGFGDTDSLIRHYVPCVGSGSAGPRATPAAVAASAASPYSAAAAATGRADCALSRCFAGTDTDCIYVSTRSSDRSALVRAKSKP